MKIWFIKTSDLYSDRGQVRNFNNMDDAIMTIINECRQFRKNGTVELIVYCNDDNKKHGCDYTIEYYDDWRE